MKKILIFSLTLILVLVSLSHFLVQPVFGQLKAQKEIIPEFNISFNLPDDIVYDSHVVDTSKFSEDNFFDSLKQILTDECISRKKDKDYFTCDNLRFDNQKIIQSTVNFYYVESSQKISYNTNFATESKQTTTWIMAADLGNGVIRFYPESFWGINGTLVSTGTGKGIYGSSYWEKPTILEKPDPKPITDSIKSIVQEKTSIKTMQGKTFIKKTVPVNIFILGDDLSSVQLSKLKSKLLTSITPVLYTNGQSIEIEYLYHYNIVSINDKISDNLKEIIESKSEKSDLMYRVLEKASSDHLWFKDTHPDWIIKKNGQPTELKYDYKLLDAKIVEDFLFSNLIEKKHENEINLVFLDYDLSEIGFLRNYKVTSYDQSTGQKFEALGLMGYGSEKNLYFIDLYSVPWKQPQLNEHNERKMVLSDDFKTLHDCTECFEKVVSDYSTNFLNYLVNPFILYDPGVHSKINVEILIYQRSGGGQSISETTLPKLINTNVLKKELSELYPYADWTIDVTLANKDSRDLDSQFVKELDRPNFFRDPKSYEIIKGTEMYQGISSEYFRPIMKKWAEQVTPKEQVGTTTKTIPVLLMLYNADYQLFFDETGEIGISYADDINPLESCCVFAVQNERDFWNQRQGVTNLLLHELGHTMGLNHPFDSFGNETITQNTFWNFYSSPMTYAFPGHPFACAGFFNNILAEREVRLATGYGTTTEMQKIDLLEKPCGITGTKFTTLEKNRVFDAMVGLQLQSANRNLQIYKADSNEDDMTKITQIESLISLSAQEFMNTNRNQLSLQHAVEANEKSIALFSPMETQPENISPENQIVIPEWIKNNAKWWAYGTISDDDFVNGIQFMIKEGIITIPNATPKDSVTTQIPEWIKNNAKWWSESQISDGDFVKGIQYLVKVGIIKIS